MLEGERVEKERKKGKKVKVRALVHVSSVSLPFELHITVLATCGCKIFARLNLKIHDFVLLTTTFIIIPLRLKNQNLLLLIIKALKHYDLLVGSIVVLMLEVFSPCLLFSILVLFLRPPP